MRRMQRIQGLRISMHTSLSCARPIRSLMRGDSDSLPLIESKQPLVFNKEAVAVAFSIKSGF